MGVNGAAPIVWWLGPAAIGADVARELSEFAIHPISAPESVPRADFGADFAGVVGVVDATALDTHLDTDAAGALIDDLLRRSGPPRRVVRIVTHEWLGRGTGAASARNAAVIAHARASALAVAPIGSTVNVVAVPANFPGAAPPGSPLPIDIGAADLAHALRYFLEADNSYVVGQVVSVCGGDDAWGNHSL